MSFLLDTSILVRLANSSDLLRGIAFAATAELHRRGEALFIGPQVIAEFWNAATRPAANNGLGMSTEEVAELVEYFESDIGFVPDSPLIYPAWKRIVLDARVTGKQVHDARLVAMCEVHRISGILTFNKRHFMRFAVAAVQVVDPTDIASPK